MTAAAECAAACGTPLDPVIVAEGWTMHPACEFPQLRSSPADYWQHVRDVHWSRKRAGKPLKGSVLWLPRHLRPARTAAPALADPEPVAPARAAPPPPPPPTSPQTAGVKLPREGSRPRHIYDLIAAAGPRGLCAAEIAKATTMDLPAQGAIGTMVGHLMLTGAVVKAPKLRDVPGQAHQSVWVAAVNVPEGHR